MKPVLHVVAGVIIRAGDNVLAAQCPPGHNHAGLWEFPGGKVEPGETHAQALARELREELGVAVRVGPHLGTVHHEQPTRTIALHAYFCRVESGEPQALEHTALRWLTLPELPALAWATADRTLSERLATGGLPGDFD